MVQQIIRPTHPAPPPDLATHLLNIIERLTIIEQMSATVLTEQDEAKVSRRSMHDKLANINTEVTSVKGDLKSLREKVDGMTPVLALHERIINQVKGGGIVLGVLWSIALIAIGIVLKTAWVWLGTMMR